MTERDGQKINLHRLLAYLGVQRADIRPIGRFLALCYAGKNLSGATDQLRLPLRDLIRVNVIMRAQLGQRLLAFDCRQGNFGLERCRVISSRTFHSCFQCAHCAFSFEQNSQ